MEMLRVKGRVESADASIVQITSDKGGKVFLFRRSDLPEIEVGEKVDILASGNSEEDSVLTVLSIKSGKKIRPIKIPNFNTLVGHMIKTRDRLQATLEQDGEISGADSIREKIAWLNRGIDLFS